MKKRGEVFLALLLVILILVLSGCRGAGDVGTFSVTQADIYKGTKGLGIELVDNAPPDEIIETSPFKVGVDLKNEGAENIEKGYLTVSLEKQYMVPVETGDVWEVSPRQSVLGSAAEQSLSFKLKGRSLESPEGERISAFYNVVTKQIDRQTEKHRSSIQVTSCYEYKTHARPTICIDPDIYNRVQDLPKSCEAKPVSMSNQGAPVAVTEVVTNMLPLDEKIDDQITYRPTFEIRVANVGDGEIVNPSKVKEACSAKAIAYGDYNKFFIEAKMNGVPLLCHPNLPPNDFKLSYDRDTVICDVNDQNQLVKQDVLAFETILEIDLIYGYTKTISDEIIIRRDPRKVMY